jgi:hypothetical protein
MHYYQKTARKNQIKPGKNRFCFIDFEFFGTSKETLDLVSCAYMLYDPETKEKSKKTHWLKLKKDKELLASEIKELKKKNFIFVAFSVEAEARSFLSLGIDVRECYWLDLAIEWKMLINHWHKYSYGKQLIKGRALVTKPPFKNKYMLTEEEMAAVNSSKPDKNLAAFCYKMTGFKLDTDRKNMIRNLIIEGKWGKLEKSKDEILEYNMSDVEYLLPLLKSVLDAYRDHPVAEINFGHMLRRGRVSADVAILVRNGYPVDVKKVKKFADSVPSILKELAEDINKNTKNSPALKPGESFFVWNKARNAYTLKQAPLREWITGMKLSQKWRKTDKGALSLSLDAFTDHFNFRHEYPETHVGAQIIRYLKTKQSLNGFMPKKKGETFFDSLGPDGRVRAYLNSYGSQSGRYQPKATGFIPLKAAWMRSLIYPPDTKHLVGFDYVSQEFLIGACWAEDENMYQSYVSGDVYLHFAKLAGAVPRDGTKKEYAKERNKFKSTVLGISYLMGPASLASKLTQDTGEEHTEGDAREMIELFNETYPDYSRKVYETQQQYILDQCIQVPDGWTMFGDNPNPRSVSNFPMQALGAMILRSVVTELNNRSVKIIFPLHDAIYIEVSRPFRPDYLSKVISILKDCFIDAFSGRGREMAKSIRIDCNAWGYYLPSEGAELPSGEFLKCQDIYIDERSVVEYDRFKKFLGVK